MTKTSVAVVFGGKSSEHTISCATAAGVLAAIDRDRYEVTPIGVTREGRWVVAADEADRWAIEPGKLPEVTDADGAQVTVPMGAAGALTVAEPGDPPEQLAQVDVVFPLLHGPFGEDGTIQGMLELAGIPYVGSGVLASAAGMDKHYMKVVLAAAGIPIGPSVTITARQWRTDREKAIAAVAELGLPVFVKPARAGSSVGITRVDQLVDLAAAVEHAQQHDPKVLVEAGIAGREIECAVLQGHGDDPPRTSGVGEIVVGSEHPFYDYEAKYFDADHLDIRIPADVPPEVVRRMQHLAAATFEALDCEGLGRVDFFYTPEGDVLVNEINTMPGFTPFSMYPMLWQAQGLSYTDLITELIELARERSVGLR